MEVGRIELFFNKFQNTERKNWNTFACFRGLWNTILDPSLMQAKENNVNVLWDFSS